MDLGAANVGGSQFLATTVAACLTRLRVKWRPSVSFTELSHLGMKKWMKYTAIFYLSIYVYNIHILYSCKYVYFWVRYVYIYIYLSIITHMKYWVLYTSKSTVPISAVISPTNLLALIRITQQDNLQAESEGFANKGATSEMTLSFLFLSLLTKLLRY